MNTKLFALSALLLVSTFESAEAATLKCFGTNIPVNQGTFKIPCELVSGPYLDNPSSARVVASGQMQTAATSEARQRAVPVCSTSIAGNVDATLVKKVTESGFISIPIKTFNLAATSNIFATHNSGERTSSPSFDTYYDEKIITRQDQLGLYFNTSGATNPNQRFEVRVNSTMQGSGPGNCVIAGDMNIDRVEFLVDLMR